MTDLTLVTKCFSIVYLKSKRFDIFDISSCKAQLKYKTLKIRKTQIQNKMKIRSILFANLAVDPLKYKVWTKVIDFGLLSNEDHNLFTRLQVFKKLKEHGLLLRLDVFAVDEDHALNDAVNRGLKQIFQITFV